MLKVKIEKGGIEYAIKKLRNKVRKSKQIDKLREKKKYTKVEDFITFCADFFI